MVSLLSENLRVDEQLSVLKSDLNLLKSFLKDADVKKHASALVKNCVEEVKEIVFDTEDIIETFLLKEELRKTGGIKQRVKRITCIIVDHKKIASELRGISKRISKVIYNMQSFGVQQMIVVGGECSNPLQERQREMRKTFPSNNENNLVALEENVKKLVGYLVKEDSIQVVSITGMGGIGKTTLARQIFNHEKIKNHFDSVVWVCISQEFTRKYVWQTMFGKLCSKDDKQNDSNLSEDDLQEKLFRLLESNNSLIVLDDIWKEEDWDMIKPVFPSKKGWKVLLTSRNERVGLRASPTCLTFKPECLSIEDSWTLFQRTAFPIKNTKEHKVDERMEEMAKQMIKHCGGLPLAVKVLGGLLAEQYTLTEWTKIFQNIKCHIVGGSSFNDRNINSIYHILYLSFEELPIYLKHCFLYFAHFPEDYTIDVGNLAYYWAAEGIPRSRYYDGATIREVGDGYIAELVKRNMVNSERDVTTTRFETCHLHDMMREVCLLKAEEENFLQIVHNTSTTNSKHLCKSRNLAVHLSNETYSQLEKMKNPKLRSLLIMKKEFTRHWEIPETCRKSGLCFIRLLLMRVLDLSFAVFKGGKLPSSIGKLIHLRYLSFNHAEVSHLPSSMRNLKKLLYLDLLVSSGSAIYIPNFLKEMQELAYLYLPWQINRKVKLELGNLVNLETLENFSTQNCYVKDLHHITRLERLSIMYNGGCTMETLSSSLSELRHLEYLSIIDEEAYVMRNDEKGFLLNGVNSKQLTLSIHMPNLPDEQHFPFRLTTIDLCWCRLKTDPMPILEKFLELKKVSLWSESFCGRRMICSAGGFPQLQNLLLFGLSEWEEWIVEDGSMPFLHVLSILKCPKLKQLPHGLRFIPSLEKLEIKTVLGESEEWKEKLFEGGEDYYKVKHIPLVEIEEEST